MPAGAFVFVTLIGSVAVVAGTMACSSVEDTNVVEEAAIRPKCTTELLLNPMPVIVTSVPVGPLAGLNPVTASVTVNGVAVVAVPPLSLTEMGAETAPLGTTAVS